MFELKVCFIPRSCRLQFGSLTRPPFVVQEKAKRGAWQKLVDAKVTPEDAQERYVKLVNDLKVKYGFEG